jgi:hypothetical protein
VSETDAQEQTAGAPQAQTPGAPEGPASGARQEQPGFGERGRMRRRARFLRKARELAYRDLGGLVFDLHRFGQRNDPVVMAKLATLRQIDTELRALEDALRERRGVTVLSEVGIAACPRCAAIHGSDDRFCPGCGLAFDTRAERPISTAPVSRQTPTLATPQQSSSQPSAPQPSAYQPSAYQPSASQPSASQPSAPQPSPAPAAPVAEPPPVKPTAAPVPARQASPGDTQPGGERKHEDDEPTKILRPPASTT